MHPMFLSPLPQEPLSCPRATSLGLGTQLLTFLFFSYRSFRRASSSFSSM